MKYIALPLGCLGIVVVAVLALIAGWISNIIQVITLAQADTWTAFLVVKMIGILVAPVGAVLGIYGWF